MCRVVQLVTLLGMILLMVGWSLGRSKTSTDWTENMDVIDKKEVYYGTDPRHAN